ncbi:RluA family pseudouridine synthase [Miltoncostaea marina]|uniref:RluA family pseudouridine synthase n=1 Tax=Miltoncostaea marina TaxID=2843215 RepID=UPI001C3DD157|nr:RluA family pseudouridine synthase [Miltoncostaea marina]
MRLRAGPEEAGRRLDAVVGAMEAVGSRAEAQRLIASGRVLVDGAARPKRHLLAAGEQVEVRPEAAPPSELEPEAVPMTVRYEDEHLLVVDKPAGVVTHPSAGHAGGTLVHGLLAHAVAGGADPSRPGIVHRLDRDTSGLLVVARSERAHRRLQRLLRDRRVERHYLALVHGAPPPALTIDRPIGRDRRNRTRMAIDAEGREAVTHVRVLERLGRMTLVEVRLETGRTHQIRVHLEAAGHPVVGDRVYGRRQPDLGLERQFLHAARLAFPHPESGEPVEVRSPLPHDLELALARARREAAPGDGPGLR